MKARTPWFDLTRPLLSGRRVHVLGVAYDGSVSLKVGAAAAPSRVREISRTTDAVDRHGRPVQGVSVVDHGDLAPKEGGRASLFAEVQERLSRVGEDELAIVLGGDNSVSIPALEAFGRRCPGPRGIVWFDAHPDLFERYDGSDESHATALSTGARRAKVEDSRVVLVGARSFATEEVARLSGSAIDLITASAASALTPAALAERISGRLSGCASVYLAFDIDVFDPGVAPGTGYPMPAGLGAETFFQVVERLFRALPVRAVDITEVAPPLDVNDVTSFLAAQIVLEVLAHAGR